MVRQSCAGFIALLLACAPANREAPVVVSRAWPTMGTMFVIEVRGSSAPGVLSAAFDSVQLVDSLLSTYRPESELSGLNASGSVEDASDVLLENLVVAREAAIVTGGAFDPTLGTGFDRVVVASRSVWFRGDSVTLDFGGSAKGDALDRALGAVPESLDVRVDLGGQTTVRSSHGSVWQVAVVDPTDATRTIAVIELANGSIATSATYEKGEHIIDPVSGAPPGDLISVTVMHRNSTWADALSTGFFVLGAERSVELADSLGVAVLLVTAGRGGLSPDRVVISEEMAAVVGLREDLSR